MRKILSFNSKTVKVLCQASLPRARFSSVRVELHLCNVPFPVLNSRILLSLQRFLYACRLIEQFSCDATGKSRLLWLFFLQVIKSATGKCTDTMTRKTWDVGAFVGQRARVKLVDLSSDGWGHINFDNLKGNMSCGPN